METVGGATTTYDYAYTADGQLETVKDGATTLESYAYDANGNRRVGRIGDATYDARRRAAEPRRHGVHVRRRRAS